jgi:hypothetical protein
VKALSYHQPRAEQIVRGEKTVDLRTWQVSYRGPLAVHASSKRRDGRCRELGYDPATLAYGAVVGTVELADIRALDAEGYEALRAEHALTAPFPGVPCYAWLLAHPARLPEPIPARGRMRLFEVDDFQSTVGSPQSPVSIEHPASGHPSIVTRHEASSSQQPTPRPYRVTPPPQPDPERPFALYTLPEAGGGYRVALYQWVDRGREAAEGQAPGALWSLEVGGDPLRAVTDHLLGTLRANGYRATELARAAGSETPFYLDEASGLRLALILTAVKPLTRQDRIAAIGQGVQAMSSEEAYYWFSKCSAGPDASRAQQALRVLLAET